MNRQPICKEMCATCPFRKGSKYAALALELGKLALTQNSRICHSTGSNAINKHTGKKPKLCRGARNLQLKYYHATGFLESPTDEAWAKKCKELGL
jgi:hypothetical protein